MGAVKTMSTKFNGNRGGHLRKYIVAPQVYNPVVLQRGGNRPHRDIFASRHARQLNKFSRHWRNWDSAWSEHWQVNKWGALYWHGAQEDNKRTVNKIIADRAKGILVITGIGRSPRALEDFKPNLDSITLNEMQFGPEEQFLTAAIGTPMPALG